MATIWTSRPGADNGLCGQWSLSQRFAGLIEQDAFSLLIHGLGSGGRVPNRGEAHAPKLRQAADHVEHDSLLSGGVEMQTVSRHDIEEVVYGQPAEHGRFEMIRRNEVLLPAVGGKEQRGRRVVSAVGEELQGEVGVSRSPLAQIKLNCIWRPGAVARPYYDK